MKERARTLVVLPGGRGSAAAAVDHRDWEGFCNRIGWCEAPPLSDEAEARLVANVGAAIRRAAENDDVERVSQVAVTASGIWPVEHLARPLVAPPRRQDGVAWARRVLVASAMVAAAAAICLVVLAALSINAHTQARVAPALRDTVPVAPARDARDEHDPRRAPDAAPESTSSPTENEVPPRPPGARLVASAPRGVSVTPTQGASPAGNAASPAIPEPSVAPLALESDDFTVVAAPAPALTVAAIHALDASPPRESITVPDVRPSPVHTVAWRAAPTDSWYGASVGPTSTGNDLPGSVGVVAHIDIAKAARF